MGLIAVLACGGLVTAMRADALGSDDRSMNGAETEVPTALAGDMVPGEVPSEITAVAEGPVIGARRLAQDDDLPAGADPDSCMGPGTFAEAPTLESALVTPDGLTVSWVGPAHENFFGGGAFASEGPIVVGTATMPAPSAPPSPTDIPKGAPAVPAPPDKQARAVCVMEWSGSDWISTGGFSGMAGQAFGAGAMGSTCCDDDGFSSSSAEVSVPDGAQWALQHRGAYTLAYPSDDLETLVISWRFRETPFGMTNRGTSVLWVDAAGEVITEEFVRF